MFKLLRNRSFASLTLTQFLGALNDNVFKQFLLLLGITEGVRWVEESSWTGSQALVTALFALPFILFSVFSGSLADRLSKTRVILACKLAEVLIMGLAAISLLAQSYELLLVTIFLMGFQSAIFGPSKYGAVPEMLSVRDLSRGNALIQTTTFLAIIGGTALGGLLLTSYADGGRGPAAVLLGLAALGTLSALFIERQAPADPGRKIHWNVFVEGRKNWSVVAADRPLVLSVLAGGVFYLIAGTLVLAVNQYGTWLELGAASISLRVALIGVGVAVGSLVAGWVSGDCIESGLIPIGLFGMALSLFSVLLAPTSVGWWSICLPFSGFFAGLYSVPIRALVQQRPSAEKRGAALGMSELADFSGVLLSAGFFALLSGVLELAPPWIFASLGVALLAFLAASLVYTHEFFVRLVLFSLVHSVYRIRVKGLDNLPEKGGALLVSNHVSFVDAFLIGASSPRPVRFLMFRAFFDLPVVGAFARYMGVIPIAKGDTPSQLARSIRGAADRAGSGELVCIFAEGAITRTGAMKAFGRGLERIARRAGVPVVPISLDRVWGSIFSFRGGRVFWKWPTRIPYPVGVQYGKPLPSDTPSWKVRNAVQEMGARALEGRAGRLGALPYRFLRSARRHGSRTAIVDGTGKKLSYRELLLATLALRPLLRRKLGREPFVGVLLPPSAGGAIVNLTLTLLGKVTVNLNYTLDNAELANPIDQAGIRTVVTSRRFLKGLKREEPPPAEETLYVEDLLSEIGPSHKAQAFALSLLPGRLLARWLNPVREATEPATVIFSSGSTGNPKGVVLTHTNILSNVRAISDVMQFSSEDRLMGVLPFFHSFGFTATLWAPLLNGGTAIYHANPLDAGAIGRLCGENGATILLATPVFYQAYLRRVPVEEFSTLRIAMAGAQKLGAPLADAWKDKYGIELLEGYGATELSPVVSVNVPDVRLLGERHKGHKRGSIGQPLPGVAVCIRDAETGEDCAPGEDGVLWVRGPGVMKGYLGDPERTAEVVKDGWYDTGDIGHFDRDGFMVITDRLSRFSKIGGEMVPHGRVEEAIQEVVARLGEADEEVEICVTAVADERKGEKLVVLHTKLRVEPARIVEALRETSLPNLFLPRAENFVEVAEVPKLGTGKIDLRGVKETARAAMDGAAVSQEIAPKGDRS